MSKDLDKEVAELLRIHAQDRTAHLHSDVNLMFEPAGDEYIFVRDGAISRSTRAEDLARFGPYLKLSRYYEWDDMEPPIVRVSDDASMAWMIVRVQIRRGAIDAATGAETILTGVYAGIMTYEKKDGRWLRVANVSTFGE